MRPSRGDGIGLGRAEFAPVAGQVPLSTDVAPIFTAGAIAGQVQQEVAQQLEALFNYQRSIQNAFAGVDNALVARRWSG